MALFDGFKRIVEPELWNRFSRIAEIFKGRDLTEGPFFTLKTYFFGCQRGPPFTEHTGSGSFRLRKGRFEGLLVPFIYPFGQFSKRLLCPFDAF